MVDCSVAPACVALTARPAVSAAAPRITLIQRHSFLTISPAFLIAISLTGRSRAGEDGTWLSHRSLRGLTVAGMSSYLELFVVSFQDVRGGLWVDTQVRRAAGGVTQPQIHLERAAILATYSGPYIAPLFPVEQYVVVGVPTTRYKSQGAALIVAIGCARGRGQSDAVTGVVSRAVDRAVAPACHAVKASPAASVLAPMITLAQRHSFLTIYPPSCSRFSISPVREVTWHFL